MNDIGYLLRTLHDLKQLVVIFLGVFIAALFLFAWIGLLNSVRTVEHTIKDALMVSLTFFPWPILLAMYFILLEGSQSGFLFFGNNYFFLSVPVGIFSFYFLVLNRVFVEKGGHMSPQQKRTFTMIRFALGSAIISPILLIFEWILYRYLYNVYLQREIALWGDVLLFIFSVMVNVWIGYKIGRSLRKIADDLLEFYFLEGKVSASSLSLKDALDKGPGDKSVMPSKKQELLNLIVEFDKIKR